MKNENVLNISRIANKVHNVDCMSAQNKIGNHVEISKFLQKNLPANTLKFNIQSLMTNGNYE